MIKKIVIAFICIINLLFFVGCSNIKNVDISESITIFATVTNFDKHNNTNILYVTDSNGDEFVIYDWTKYIADGTHIRTGEGINITFNGNITTDNPSSLCGVVSIQN